MIRNAHLDKPRTDMTQHRIMQTHENLPFCQLHYQQVMLVKSFKYVIYIRITFKFMYVIDIFVLLQMHFEYNMRHIISNINHPNHFQM